MNATHARWLLTSALERALLVLALAETVPLFENLGLFLVVIGRTFVIFFMMHALLLQHLHGLMQMHCVFHVVDEVVNALHLLQMMTLLTWQVQ